MNESIGDKCAECGRTQSNVASITQWISLGDKCSCGAKPTSLKGEKTAVAASSQDLCRRCGGTLSKQSGSLTQWVFRTAPCSCAEPLRETVSGLPRESVTTRSISGDDINYDPAEPELEVDPTRFPTARYAAMQLLGSGAQGDVFRAKDRILGRMVCIKLLRTAKLLPEQVIRFQREAKAGGKLAHPNLTTVLDFGLNEHGQPFLVMELCPGIPLSELCNENVLSFDLIFEIFLQICDGMQYAHEHGVLHRDLKTSNILVKGINTDSPKVKVIDFGLSGLIDTIDDTGRKLTKGGLLMGTPAFMSPEQVKESDLDERSDVYSVGCILFETLTGRQVFEGETALDILNQQAESPPPTLHEANPGYVYPDGLEALVADLLRKDPNERVQSMAALSKRIRQLLNSAQAEAEDEATMESTRQEHASKDFYLSQTAKKRFPMFIGGAILVILSVVTIAVLQSILSENAALTESALRITKHDIADAPWAVASGQVHGVNVKRLIKISEANLKIADTRFSDEDLPAILQLPITCLDVSGTEITDDGLRKLTAMQNLRGLILSRCKKISDASMDEIKKFPRLRVLAVADTSVTDTGVAKIAQNPSISSLDIADLPGVTSKSLVALQALPELLFLRIGNTGVRPEDFKLLHSIKGLKSISVANSNLKNHDLDELQTLKLLALDFSHNKQITLARIRKLDFVRYWRITFDGCGLTPEEKTSVEFEITEKMPTPIPIIADAIISDPLRPADMRTGLYGLAYNTKIAEPEFLHRMIREFKQAKGIPDDFY